MENITLNLPAMYGDHHVTEVRRVLLETAGVEDVYASSSFRVVEVGYNPGQISVEQITSALENAGYTEEITIPLETGVAAYGRESDGKDVFFRHTAAYEQVSDVVSFAQKIESTGRPLWPCPGMGVVSRVIVEE